MEYKGLSGLNGSYKLSETVINRILSRDFAGDVGTKCDSISNYEILALIHFSQICDISGVIYEYKIPDLADILGCSRRACYNIVKNLEHKGFLMQSNSAWTGYRSITILDNDFSSVNYQNTRYVNTNYCYFNHNHADYRAFKGLSLYAKKLLLVVLLKYNRTYGYRVDLDTLKQYLNVSKKSKIMAYISELRSMFDPRVFNVSPNQKLRIKNHNLNITAKLPCFVAETSITEDKDCFTKHLVETMFRRYGIGYGSFEYRDLSSKDIKSKCLQKIYSIYVSYNSKGVSSERIMSALMDSVSLSGRFDEYALYRINQVLKPQVQNVS